MPINGDGRITSYDASEILLLALVEEDKCGALAERVRGAVEGVSVEGFSGMLAGSQRILVRVSNSEKCSFGIVVEGGKSFAGWRGGDGEPHPCCRAEPRNS